MKNKLAVLPTMQPADIGLPESSNNRNFIDTPSVDYDPIYQMEYEKINEPYGKDVPIGYLNNNSVDFHYMLSSKGDNMNIVKIAKYLKKSDLDLAVGEIMVAHIGYDASHPSFYQVVSLSSSKIELRQVETKWDGNEGSPEKNKFIGPSITKKYDPTRKLIEIKPQLRAFKWDGKPVMVY